MVTIAEHNVSELRVHPGINSRHHAPRGDMTDVNSWYRQVDDLGHSAAELADRQRVIFRFANDSPLPWPAKPVTHRITHGQLAIKKLPSTSGGGNRRSADDDSVRGLRDHSPEVCNLSFRAPSRTPLKIRGRPIPAVGDSISGFRRGLMSSIRWRRLPSRPDVRGPGHFESSDGSRRAGERAWIPADVAITKATSDPSESASDDATDCI